MKWYERLLQSHADYVCSDDLDVKDPRFLEYAENVRNLVINIVNANIPGEKQEHVDLGELYRTGRHVPIDQLSPQQLASKIIYPFCSRMDGSFEDEFAQSGELKTYLLALKEKINIEEKR